MSDVHVILAANNRLMVFKGHWRVAKKVLVGEAHFDELELLWSGDLDEGYVVLDMDLGEAVDCQHAFRIGPNAAALRRTPQDTSAG